MSKIFVDTIEGNTGSTITISDSVPTLKTGTIQSSGGTTALSIDSSARVQRNVQPYFFANAHATSVIASADTVLSADNDCFSNVVNTGSHMSDAGIFTCPVAGMYQVSIVSMNNTNLSDVTTQGKIMHGSTKKLHLYNSVIPSSVQNWSYSNIAGNVTFLCAVNDQIKVQWTGLWYGSEYSLYNIVYLG